MSGALITPCNSGFAKDPELIAPRHIRLSDEESEAFMRETLDFWD